MGVSEGRIWSSLSNMSWDELETRVRQEVCKRLDVTLCRIGLPPGRNGLHSPFGLPGKFFFSTNEVAGRVSFLREHLPHDAEAIVAEADEICAHRFRLLGYRDLHYGAEIDWHLDAVHNLRSPLIPWFKIKFLDFAAVGDHKVTWELSRHQHLITLAKAWLLTEEEAYAQEILGQWYSWQRANPYPLGANWASSLEVAFRSLSWIWLLHLLAGCPVVAAAFRSDLLRGLALNGRHIERYLSTYFSPNTHLLGEAVALFFVGTLCPQISSAPNWKKKGWRIVQQEAQRQVRPDGLYFEQSLYYHVYALDFFLHARLLALRNGMEIPPAFDQVVRKMLAVVQALAQTSPPDGFGDDDGGRVFNPRRNRAEHMEDPLAIGAALFPDESLRASATLTEEAIWLFGEPALAATTRQPNSHSKSESQFFPAGGLYLAGSSDPFAQQMVIDAGPQGAGRSGHGHADALSVKLALCGHRWLVDAGTYCYVGPERNIFRGTRAHNTLAVDRVDQATPDGPFAWSSIPDSQANMWIAGSTFTLFAGSHSGYERLPEPVRHRRFVFHLNGNFWLIRDIAEGSGSHLLETSWHFAPEINVSSWGKNFVATSASGQLDNPQGLNHLTFVPVDDSRWKSELLSEHVSPAYGEERSAPVVRCGALVALPAEHAVLLIPTVGGMKDAGMFMRDERPREDLAVPEAAYRYEHGRVKDWMIFQQAQRGSWNFGPWTSDAKFLYFCVRDRRVDHVVFCGGSFAQLGGETLISHHATLQCLEWTNRGGQHRLACSDESAAQSFSGSVLDLEIVI